MRLWQLNSNKALKAAWAYKYSSSGSPCRSRLQSLGNDTKIELLSVRKRGANTFANVFGTRAANLAHFEVRRHYLGKKKDKKRQCARSQGTAEHDPHRSVPLELQALWTDDRELLPEDPELPFWWEVWLPVRSQREAVVADFRNLPH